jgi:hypothetical protein
MELSKWLYMNRETINNVSDKRDNEMHAYAWVL